VLGWLAQVDLKWLTAFIGVVGGGAITRLFSDGSFGAYGIGLTVAFFLRMILFSPAGKLFEQSNQSTLPTPEQSYSWKK
jgi:hypothetical protein